MRSDESSKVSGELRLITEADLRRDVGRAHAPMKQFLRARDAKVGEIRVRRHADLRTERAAQMELVEVTSTSAKAENTG